MSRYKLSVKLGSRTRINWRDPEDVLLPGNGTGPAGNVKLLAVNKVAITVKIGGWSENPGSRYSGLKSYYPAEVITFLLDEVKGTEGWGYEIISHDVRRKKT